MTRDDAERMQEEIADAYVRAEGLLVEGKGAEAVSVALLALKMIADLCEMLKGGG